MNHMAASLLNISGVKDTAGILRATNTSTTVATTTSNSSSGGFGAEGGVSVTGIDTNKLSLIGVDTINGTAFTNTSTNQVIMGTTIAQSLNKTVGDTIDLYGKNFTITGTYETGNFITDAGIMMPLSTLQNLTSNQNKISDVLVKVT